LGLEVFASLGPEVIDEFRQKCIRVFADLKLNDIPNTVAGASRALTRWGADMITVHASGGRAMLEAAVGASREEAKRRGGAPPLMLAVTILTSLDDESVREIGWGRTIEEQVVEMAGLAIECGLDGIVASARETAVLRARLGPEPVIVTPGIRMPGAQTGDQARTATPKQALEAGADYLVIGRTITADPDPKRALRELRIAAGLAPEVG
jgi:orotidine-5'-phosphate decarboxylase